jgi:cytochrome c biogenesis protein CcmG/thiol:disulfide interchange protein DsbE
MSDTTSTATTGLAKTPLIILAVVIGFFGFLVWGLSDANKAQPIKGQAPDFELTFFDGHDGGLSLSRLNLSDLRGKVVLLNFWASWCVPCEEEAPDLQAAWQAFKDRDVVFLGVSWADNPADALDYLKRFNITYANGADVQTKVGPLYRITGVPETFIVDRNGNVVFFKANPLTLEEISRELELALANEAKSP